MKKRGWRGLLVAMAVAIALWGQGAELVRGSLDGHATEPAEGLVQAEPSLAVQGSAAGLAASPWPKFRGDASNTGRVRALSAAKVVQWAVNGHWYERVDAGQLSWTAARAAAEQRTHEGMTAHLVTVSSAEENRFLTEHAALGQGTGALLEQYWLGGFQPAGSAEPAGDWRWVTEEPFDYANWGSGEPNDGWGKEDALMFWGPPTADGKAWNDGIGPDEGFGLGYIVEYEPATGPPEILGPPQDQTAVLGATVVMEVTARGQFPLNYQWYKEGSPLVEGGRIGGVRTARLSLTNVVAADAGLYSVQLTNLLGWVASRKATLTVTSGGPVDAHTLLYLSFDETLNGAQGERPTTARGVEFVPGVVGAGAWIKKDSALVYSSLGNITASQGTVDCWVKPSWRGGDTATYFFLNWGTDGGAVFSKDGASNLRFFFNQWRTEVGAANGVSGWPPNVWHHLAFTWKSSSPGPQRSGLKIYVDGRLFTSSSSPTAIAEPLRDGQRLQVGGDLSDSVHSLQAVLDELRISDVERSASEIAAVHAQGLALLVPGLVSQPGSRTNAVGTTVAFAVLTRGYEPLSYRWRKDGTPLVDDERVSGTTQLTLTIANCQPSDAGTYSVTVRNPYGQVTSSPAMLAVTSTSIQYVTNVVWVETVAGSGVAGWADGVGTQAQFNRPNGGAVDAAGSVYVADTMGHRIRKISPGGEVSTLAGSGVAGHADGPGATAQFDQPLGVGVDGAGTVYVVEAGNHCVRKITAAGVVSTLAGNLSAGYRDGAGATAQFNFPNDVVVDGAGDLYVTEFDNHTVRRVTAAGVVSTWVGDRTAGYRDGPRGQARLTQPGGIAVDGAGNLYVSEWGGQRVRKVSADGMVSTVAGTGEAGHRDGAGSQAQFNQPDGMAVDGEGNVWVTDYGNQVIRRIGAGGKVETVAGTGVAGYVDGEGKQAQFYSPAGIALVGSGQVVVADWGNHVVRRVSLVRPVAIVGEPQSREVWLGEEVRFGVVAEGSEPMSYRWYKDGVALGEGLRVEGVEGPELRLRLAQAEDAGSYVVRVWNRAGERSSQAATLAVREPEPTRAVWMCRTDGLVSGCPAIGWDGTLFVTYRVNGQDKGGVHAIDGATGARKWTFEAGGQVSEAAAVGLDGTVYFGSNQGVLYALDGPTGEVKWQSAGEGSVLSAPAVAANGMVLVNFGGVAVFALEGSTGAKAWEFPVEAFGESAPVISSDGSVYVASGQSGLHALDGMNGVERWQVEVSPTAGASSPPALGPDGAVYVGTVSNGLVAVDGISGAVRWVAELRPHLRAPVVGWGGTLYVGSADLSEPALYALDTATGEERWRRVCAAPGPGSPVLAEDGSLYVVSGQRLLALDAVSGAKKAEFATAEGEGFSTYPALGDRGLVYLGAGNAVYAFEELGWVAGHGGLAYAPWPAYRGDAHQSGRYSCRAEQAAVRAPAERRVWHEGVAGTVEVRLRPDASLALQWYHDGVAVPGATNPVLTIATVTRAEGGWYELVASNVLCQVRAGTFVTTDSTLEPLRFPAWRWEGDGGSVTVELAPAIVGPWTEVGRFAGGENGGVYVETDLRRPARFYRMRAAEGGGPTRFTASGMIPGWWYQSGVGSRHRIEYVWSGSGWTNWVALPELTLPASPHLFLDTDAFDHPNAVYRTTPVP